MPIFVLSEPLHPGKSLYKYAWMRVWLHLWVDPLWCLYVWGCRCVGVCLCARFPCGSKSPDWHVGSVVKQQVWDTLMAFTDGVKALPMGGLLLHLLIYSFSTAEEALRPMWLFPIAKVPWEHLGCFLIQSCLPPHSFPKSLSPVFFFLRQCCVCVWSVDVIPVLQANW